jgi:hypothetical protein
MLKKGYHQEIADTKQYKNTGQAFIFVPEVPGQLFG